METLSRETPDPWWVTGFLEREGSFTYNRNGRQIAVLFQVKSGERLLLEDLRRFFGVGRLYEVNSSSGMYRVGRRDELLRVTEHFERYPLRSTKGNAYAIWREMVSLKQNFRGHHRQDLETLAQRLSEQLRL